MRHALLMSTALLGLPLAAWAGSDPFYIGSASAPGGSSKLAVRLTTDCPKDQLVQVLAVEVGDHDTNVTATDSRGVNWYQAGGGSWRGPGVRGFFLATTSPREATNAGLAKGDVITLTYANKTGWKGAIAACIPTAETRSGSADNTMPSRSPAGTGTTITLKPPPHPKSPNEPLFIATVLQGDSSDAWTESDGYKTLFTLQDGVTVNLAYQIIGSGGPTAYSATNSAPRPWSASNRSYKTLPK